MSDVSRPGNVAKNLRAALITTGVQLVGTALLVLANKQGVISDDTTKRGVMVLIGLCVAAYGNRMPKSPDGPPPQTLPLLVLRQSVLRVGGWGMMLGGIAFAAVWAFAPREVTALGSIIALGGAMAVVVAHAAWRIYAYRRTYER